MKLSEIIKSYRERMGISQREFARKCNVSNSYISLIENECNPKTGKPITPTLEQYNSFATAMGISIDQLFEGLDADAPVMLNPTAGMDLSHTERLIVVSYRNADSGTQSAVRKLLDIREE